MSILIPHFDNYRSDPVTLSGNLLTTAPASDADDTSDPAHYLVRKPTFSANLPSPSVYTYVSFRSSRMRTPDDPSSPHLLTLHFGQARPTHTVWVIFTVSPCDMRYDTHFLSRPTSIQHHFFQEHPGHNPHFSPLLSFYGNCIPCHSVPESDTLSTSLAVLERERMMQLGRLPLALRTADRSSTFTLQTAQRSSTMMLPCLAIGGPSSDVPLCGGSNVYAASSAQKSHHSCIPLLYALRRLSETLPCRGPKTFPHNFFLYTAGGTYKQKQLLRRVAGTVKRPQELA
ncbi:hypothetical protein PHSY_002963 [Pseudozyma hubeiensis SY62]|uniref:Uncharacterized protein n=1 Tax=Pseudozyma hubeiensis (strain SY62) TaxID=1305764 RepID=R9P224_PSEHS|nr:hypothetical protein PHSY_002963 [Pseudozyma hubeiensis SY62]GAC95388.1 hypothetical protein PHSY_002963 [Pseudozyma hubeiensis SY62]